MRSDVVDYDIIGDDLQLVEVELNPGETVIAEAGAMAYMDSGISFQAKMGDGSEPNQGFFSKLVSAGKRAFTGESVFMTHFTNDESGKRRVAFSAPYPGKILPIDLNSIDGELLCQKDCFLAAVLGTKIDIGFNRRFGAGLFGGEGFILQKLSGNGTAFIHAGGAVIEKQLNNSAILVDTGCIVAFEGNVEYDIKRAGNLKSMVFGGEGLFLATLSGTGRVWLQSLPFSKLADRILYHAPSAGGSSKGQGSVLGSIAGILED